MLADACLAPDTMGFRCVRNPASAKASAGDKKLPTGFVTAPIYLEHQTGPNFPERPARRAGILVLRLQNLGF